MRKLFLILIAFSTLVSYNSQTNLDSLWGVWKDSYQADTNRLNALHTIVLDEYLSSSDSSLYYSQLGYDYSIKIENKNESAKFLTLLGHSFYFKGDYENSINYHQNSLKIRRGNNDIKGVSDCFFNIGLIYQEQNNYKNALHYILKSLELRKQLKNHIYIAYSLNEIGKIYFKIGDVSNAIISYNKVINGTDFISDSLTISNAFTELGIIHKSLDESGKKSSIDYFKKSIKIRKKLGWQNGVGWNLKDIATTYKDLKEIDSAIHYIQKAIAVFKTINDTKEIGYSYIVLANLNMQQGNYNKTKIYLTKANKIFIKLNDEKGIIESNVLLSAVLIKNKNYKDALP